MLGWVQPSTAALKLNGQSVPVYKTGGFLTYLPVRHGEWVLDLEVVSGTETVKSTHTVRTAASFVPPVELRIDTSSLNSSVWTELSAGDRLMLAFRGTAGGRAWARIGSWQKRWPMFERRPGVYEGSYQFTVSDEPGEGEMTYGLEHPRLGKTRAKSPGRLRMLSGAPRAARISSDSAIVKTAPGKGYMLFLPKGVQVLVQGRQGEEVRLLLEPGLSGWVAESSLEYLPEGSPPRIATLSTLRTLSQSHRATQVEISMNERVPYRVEEVLDPPRILVTFYQSVAYVNWIVYDSSDTLVQEVFWRQLGQETVQVQVDLKKAPLWGYHVEYSNSGFVLSVRRSPAWAPMGKSALSGRIIALDPGHSGTQEGAKGPLGTLEKNVNLAIALKLKGLLEKGGAKVVMTRTEDEEVALEERPKLAWEAGAEIFVSVHNNALPDGDDPFAKTLGFSVFYYHPHSRPLAEAVHRAYKKYVPLPDEGLRYGNLLVARATQMPSILTESAYLILPQQEDMLLKDSFQLRCAKAMLEGVEKFLDSLRRKDLAQKSVRQGVP